MNKLVATSGMMDLILTQLPMLPIRDMEDDIRNEIVGFNLLPHSDCEKYDFIVKISKKDCTKINDKMCVGEISTFVRELCALENYYIRPKSNT